MLLSIRQFAVTRSRLVAGGAFFRSEIFGPTANLISIQFQDGILSVTQSPVLPDWVRKYDGVSKLAFDGSAITIDDVTVIPGNELKTSSNRMIFPDPFVISPTVEVYNIATIEDSSGGMMVSGFSLEDARSKVQQSRLISMPIRPSGDVQAQGVDTPFIQPFGRVFMAGGGGLPPNATECDTGPFRTLVKVSGREDETGTIQGVDEMYEWDGLSKNAGNWKPYRQ